MAFSTDQRLQAEAGHAFGDYVTTFTSRTGQVRADLFRVGRVVQAHVSFPSGLNPATVSDPYVSDLRHYAREHGFPDQFRLIYS